MADEATPLLWEVLLGNRAGHAAGIVRYTVLDMDFFAAFFARFRSSSLSVFQPADARLYRRRLGTFSFAAHLFRHVSLRILRDPVNADFVV